MKRLIQVCFIVFALMFLASVSLADNFVNGLRAYNSGDYKKAHELWLIEAVKDSAATESNLALSAQFHLGILYYNGQGVPQDYVEAAKWYHLVADQWHLAEQYSPVDDAQLNLGLMYARGRGVPQDLKQAVEWFRLSAGLGNIEAQLNLGVMYYNGQGVPQDIG